MKGPADAYPFPTLPAPLRFAIALAAVSMVFVTDAVGRAPLDAVSRFLLLGTAVLASAWFAGTGIPHALMRPSPLISRYSSSRDSS